MSTPNKQKGTRLEKRVVELAHGAGLEAHKQPMSGQLAEYPSDAVIGQFLVECKCGYERIDAAGEKSFSFQMTWLNKVEAHAKKAGYRGAVVVVRPGSSRRTLAIVDLNVFLALLKRAAE